MVGICHFSSGLYCHSRVCFCACWTPSIELRRFIWGFSAVVQGIWLVLFILAVRIRNSIQWLEIAWWTIAFGISVYGLFKDVNPAVLLQQPSTTDEAEKRTPP